MRLTPAMSGLPVLVALVMLATCSYAAFSGDVVTYWIDQTAILMNGTLIGGLQTPPTDWAHAVVSGAMYNAALNCDSGTLQYKQIAVSSAAHNALTFIFQGTRNYDPIDIAYRTIRDQVASVDRPFNQGQAFKCGQDAADPVIKARANDGHNNFVDYNFWPTFRPAAPGVYVPTVPAGSYAVPDDPQTQYIRFFGLTRDPNYYRAPRPLSPTGPGYQDQIEYVKAFGGRVSTARTQEQTDIALFWRESAPIKWNRITTTHLANRNAANPLASAKLFAQLNYAIANSVIVAWWNKFTYNTWRPESALHRTDIWLSTGVIVSDPQWMPLITPTPKEQEYLSGHGMVGGAAAGALAEILGTDAVDVTVSSLVGQDDNPVLTRRFTSLVEAGREIAYSRVYGGLHFNFTAESSVNMGLAVGKNSVREFDAKWSAF